jgi:polyhydroxybutyrate depolymerase
MRRVGVGVLLLAAASLLTGPARGAAARPTPAAGGPSCALTGTATIESATFDGAPREYRLVGPARPGRRRLPLILNFHGLRSDALRQAVYSQLEEKAPARGYVVITPEGSGAMKFWNILPDLPRPDDVAYAETLIDAAVADACVDRRRVYATGISNGAGMSTLLACDLGKRIAAIAPVAGVNLVAPCTKGAPVSVVAFHGEADAVVKYTGGPPTVGARIDAVPVEEAVESFATRDRCRRRPTTTRIGEEVRRTKYQGCRAGSEVVLYSVVNGGHTWPGSIDVTRLGYVTREINATDLILDFFDAHPGR